MTFLFWLWLQAEATRHRAIVLQFMKLTGYPNGRQGYVVDHVIPLCAGGPDEVTNMQWQTLATSYKKDAYERALCKAMATQGYHLEKNK